MKHDVFISYSSKDAVVAQDICSALEQNNVACWMAPRDIPAGAEYGDLIDDAIRTSLIMVVVFSETAASSMWVKAEMNVAFEEQKVIIPFRMDETPLKGQNRLILNHKHWIDAYPDYKMKIDDIVIAVLRALGRPLADEEPQPEKNVVSPGEKENVVVKNIVVAEEESRRPIVEPQPSPVRRAPKRRGWLIAIVLIALLLHTAGTIALAVTVAYYMNPSWRNYIERVETPERYPFTSTRKVTEQDLYKCSLEDLKIMRNEIYARHGYIFDSQEMRDYFSRQSWYRPTTKKVTLSELEKYNVAFIKDFEKRFK